MYTTGRFSYLVSSVPRSCSPRSAHARRRREESVFRKAKEDFVGAIRIEPATVHALLKGRYRPPCAFALAVRGAMHSRLSLVSLAGGVLPVCSVRARVARSEHAAVARGGDALRPTLPLWQPAQERPDEPTHEHPSLDGLVSQRTIVRRVLDVIVNDGSRSLRNVSDVSIMVQREGEEVVRWARSVSAHDVTRSRRACSVL
jgi:hypothetical protein